jgi:cell division protein FtsW (lipid II flippase)
MNSHIDAYLDKVCSHIRCRAAHKEIREELSAHIGDVRRCLAKEGVPKDEADRKAVAAMGDSKAVGVELDKTHKPQVAWSLLAICAVILLFGGAVMYVCGDAGMFGKGQIRFGTYLAHMATAIALMLPVMFLDYRKIWKYHMIILGAALLLILYGAFFGTDVGGVRRWIGLPGGGMLNVAELSVLVIVPIACLLYKYRDGGLFGVYKLLLVTMAAAVLLFGLPFLPGALLLVCGVGITLFVSIMKKRFKSSKIKCAAVFFVSSVSFIMFLVYVCAALPWVPAGTEAFLTRGHSDPTGAGWQTVMADKWLETASFIGAARETVEGLTIEESLPDFAGKFILVTIIAKFGWASGLALMLAIATLIVRLFRMTARINNSLGYFLSLSACVTLTLRFVTGILNNFSLIPSSGFTVPFISYNSSGYIVDMILTGVVLSVWRYNNIFSQNPSSKFEAFVFLKLLLRPAKRPLSALAAWTEPLFSKALERLNPLFSKLLNWMGFVSEGPEYEDCETYEYAQWPPERGQIERAGVAENLSEARKWLQAAAALGSVDAIKALENIPPDPFFK